MSPAVKNFGSKAVIARDGTWRNLDGRTGRSGAQKILNRRKPSDLPEIRTRLSLTCDFCHGRLIHPNLHLARPLLVSSIVIAHNVFPLERFHQR
jgi:hypothetical protein